MISGAFVAAALTVQRLTGGFGDAPRMVVAGMSRDKRLWLAIIATMLCGAATMWLVFWPEEGGSGRAAASGLTLLVLAVCLGAKAWGRASKMASRSWQIERYEQIAVAHLRRWETAANRLAPEEKKSWTQFELRTTGKGMDFYRFVFVRSNPQWGTAACEFADEAIRVAAKQLDAKDELLASAALEALAGITRAYVKGRGRTFPGSNPLFPTKAPWADPYASHTLESLRRAAARSREARDEAGAILWMQGMQKFANELCRIEYANDWGGKREANLAAQHLVQEIEWNLAMEAPNVTIWGLRLLRYVAQEITEGGDPDSGSRWVRELGRVAGESLERGGSATLTGRTGMKELACYTQAVVTTSAQLAELETMGVLEKTARAMQALGTQIVSSKDEADGGWSKAGALGGYLPCLEGFALEEDHVVYRLGKVLEAVQRGKPEDQTGYRWAVNIVLWGRVTMRPIRAVLDEARGQGVGVVSDLGGHIESACKKLVKGAQEWVDVAEAKGVWKHAPD